MRPTRSALGSTPARFPMRNPASLLAVMFIVAVVLMPPSRPLGFEHSTSDAVALSAQPASNIITSALPQIPPPREVVTPTPEPTVPPTPPPDFITYVSADTGVQANELGRIPILMYHAFVHEEENTDEWTVTFDQFREQLDWLVANDFVMIGLNSIIHRNIDVPPGKRPVVLTFDDASAGQFRLREAKDGSYELNPDTAVGVLEEYRQKYPEFAGPAFFAVLPYNCFAYEDDSSSCEERLNWLVDHDYEVGNHTMGHQNLTDVSIERLKEEVVGPTTWFAERLDADDSHNLSDVLVLPFGAYPANDTFRNLLFDGFWLEGEYFVPKLVIEVGGGPARAPYNIEWATNLPRYNTDPATFAYWADQIESGEVEIYISDGSPETVTVPEGWTDSLNEELLKEDGHRVIVEMSGPAATPVA